MASNDAMASKKDDSIDDVIEDDVIEDVAGDAPLGGPKWWGEGPAPTLLDLKPKEREFSSILVLKDTIKFLAVQHAFPFTVKQTNAQRYEVGCDEGKENNTKCAFHIKARCQQKLEGKFSIIKSDIVHSCGCMFTSKRYKNRSLGARFVLQQAEGLLADCPKATPRDIISHVKRTTGVTMHYRTAHRGKRLCIDESNCNEVMSFQYIQPYFEKIEAKMPGSVAVMERDEDDKLLRTFVMLKPIMDSFKYGMPVITVDACHLRNQFKGCLMAVTIVDGLKQTQLLAWGTCPVENGEHWEWFLRLFKDNMPQEDIGYGPVEAGASRRVITIISDREKGIAKALNQFFPTSFHVFCYFHIEKNVKTINPGLKEETRMLMLEACKSKRVSTFDRIMDKLRLESPGVYNYLISIPLDKWVTAFSPPNRKWGINTSNASESMNKWMNEERNLSHLHLHAALVSKVMDRQNTRRKLHKKYVKSSPTALFPKKTQELLLNLMARGARLKVTSADDGNKFLVRRKWEVNLDRKSPSCSCNEYLHTGLPCKHIAAALCSMDGIMESELGG